MKQSAFTSRNSFRNAPFTAFLLWLLLLVLTLPPNAAAGEAQSASPTRAIPRVASVLTGSLPTRDGERLHLVAGLGNVIIHTQNSTKLDYRVHLEADASQKDAKRLLESFRVTARGIPGGVYLRGRSARCRCHGRLWITFEVNVPRNYNLDVSTGGGNIQSDDIAGSVVFSTAGGNIMAGNIGGAARLRTDGGHITLKNVAADLIASTGGGHITAGAISGDATLHTGGGHIRVGAVQGVARLDTGGGNITIERSGADLGAETAGGQIDVGEAAGLVRAKTGGGGIRVARVSGPANLQAVSGSIYLTQVASAVKASTVAGGITAWFARSGSASGPCELQSSDGDIVVYIPRQLPVTIDARIQMGEEHRVTFDPAFPLKVSYDASNGERSIRAEGALNGGGEILRLRTVAGNIRVAVGDAGRELDLYKQQMKQLQDQMEQLQRQMLLQLRMFDGSRQMSTGQSQDELR